MDFTELTRVQMDAALECGGLDDMSERAAWLTCPRSPGFEPYRMQADSLFGISSYTLWSGNEVERLEQMARDMLYPECPLRFCEDFDFRQTHVPVPFWALRPGRSRSTVRLFE